MKKLDKRHYKFLINRYKKAAIMQVIEKDNYVKFPHTMFHRILFDHSLTKRQRACLFLILRTSVGFGKHYAKIRTSDFKLINIRSTDARRTLRELEAIGYIVNIREKNLVFLNDKIIHKNHDADLDRLSKLLRKNVVTIPNKDAKRSTNIPD
jgi:hypothetical protein